MGEDRRRCSGSEDRISGLPDELLHAILVRLYSTRAAARSSVLSRRWRHVWAHLPELFLGGSRDAPPPLASLPDAVDAALAAYSATAAPLERLHITLRRGDGGHPVQASRAASWLRFASRHVVGELRLFVPAPGVDGEEEEVLELPACHRAKSVRLTIHDSWRLRPQPAGLFAALTSLRIDYGRMEASELTDLVCKRCPQLRDLNLSVDLVDVSDVSVLSGSLQSLLFFVLNIRRLEVVAPRLEELLVYHASEAHITSPKLAELVWNGEDYDPRLHKFDDVGRHLRLLEIGQISGAASLMRQFDEVDKLKLQISIPWETAGYGSLLNETNQLPKCRTLAHSCPLSCPCRLAESGRVDGIALSFLEEVKLHNFASSSDELEFVEELSRCNAAVLKKLVINYAYGPATPLTMAICEKVRSMWRPNVSVEFYVFLDGRLVRFD
ncbi:F-box/LRR-repeat protein 25 [Setaria italica]|uniref:F-box/LRR-repeat protein 25 n=1 Tax=Setaria italica TaxID=4555 RepID=UPI0003508954|nr:F-box/LRR-repeat protein 25 [Setaria italica]